MGTLSNAFEKSRMMTLECPLLSTVLARSWMVIMSTRPSISKAMLGICKYAVSLQMSVYTAAHNVFKGLAGN